MLLVRSVLLYASPIWYNTNAATMEKLRRKERIILRKCLFINRSSHSDYKKYTSNKKLYNEAKITRIDNFIIKLNRDYFANTKKVTENKIIQNLTNTDTNYINRAKITGYLPPEAFVQLDKESYLTK